MKVSGSCAVLALTIFVQSTALAVDPPAGKPELLPAKCTSFAQLGAASAKAKAAQEALVLNEDAMQAELAKVAGAVQDYGMAVRSGDVLAAQKLAETLQVTLGVDPTLSTSEVIGRNLSVLGERSKAAKKISDGLSNLHAELNGIRTGEEQDAHANSNWAVRSLSWAARGMGLTRAVDRTRANMMSGADNISTINNRITELVETAKRERTEILNENAEFQAIANHEHMEALRMRAIAERIMKEREHLEPGSEEAVAAEVTIQSYQEAAEAHLLNERVKRDGVKTNLVVLEQINSSIGTLNTTVRVQLSGIATNMATAQRAAVAQDMAAVILAVKETHDQSAITVAKAIADSATATASAQKDSDGTRKKVLGLIEGARKTTEAKEKELLQGREKRITALLAENAALEQDARTRQTKLLQPAPGGAPAIGIAAPATARLTDER